MDRFTERSKRVLQLAREEAGRLNHEYIGTEHLLLGLTAEGSGVAAEVLRRHGLDLGRVRAAVEALVQAGPAGTELPERILLTPRARKALDGAHEVARELGHSHVGTEHLLLGLLREGQGVAARALHDLGLQLEGVHAETLTLLGQHEAPIAHELAANAEEEGEPALVPQREIPWPEWVKEAVNAPEIVEAEQRVAEARSEKEAAVERQDFETAATKRDEERGLRAGLPREASLRALRALLNRLDDPSCVALRELGLDLEAAQQHLDKLLAGDSEGD